MHRYAFVNFDVHEWWLHFNVFSAVHFSLRFFWCMSGSSWCLRPWKLSMLVFVSATPGIVPSPRKASPAKSFAVRTSWSITVKRTIALGSRHCSTLTELEKRKDIVTLETFRSLTPVDSGVLKIRIKTVNSVGHWIPRNWISIWIKNSRHVVRVVRADLILKLNMNISRFGENDSVWEFK